MVVDGETQVLICVQSRVIWGDPVYMIWDAIRVTDGARVGEDNAYNYMGYERI